MCLSLVSLWVPGWASAEVLLLVSMEAVGASPSPPSGQVGDDSACQGGLSFLTPRGAALPADNTPVPQAPATFLSPATAATSRGP